jgi:hypothetical protein
MLESFIEAGRQEPGDLAGLVYGQSITDSCMDISTPAGVLRNLAAAVRLRRARSASLARTRRWPRDDSRGLSAVGARHA